MQFTLEVILEIQDIIEGIIFIQKYNVEEVFKTRFRKKIFNLFLLLSNKSLESG